jgi:hypothetical protein
MPKLSKSGTAEALPRKQLYKIVRFYAKAAPEIIERGLTRKSAQEWIQQHKLIPDRHPDALFYGYEEDEY